MESLSRRTRWVGTSYLIMSAKKTVAKNLAAAFLAGAWSYESLVRRGIEACGSKGGGWLRKLVKNVLANFGNNPQITPEELSGFIHRDYCYFRLWGHFRQKDVYPLKRLFWVPPAMNSGTGPSSDWTIPGFTTKTQLAEWFECSPNQLDWYSGKYLFQKSIRDTNYPRYTYHWIKKRSGRRLLEKPIPALKKIQRRLLSDILNRIPPHSAVHSYLRGHSIAGYVRPHSGKRVVIRMDLQDFFPSIRAGRVYALFRSLGYPKEVTRVLTGLCVNAVPAKVFNVPEDYFSPGTISWRQEKQYRNPHLPQGAPTSPMLSNLCIYRLDKRLSSLAHSLDATYTRYADDLAFSGGKKLEQSYRRFHVAVCVIVMEEGFEINTRKTRLMRQGVRQRLAGLVVNAHPNIARRDYDRLKAILHNCARLGPESQTSEDLETFRASLIGKVQFVSMIQRERGEKLQKLLEKIDW